MVAVACHPQRSPAATLPAYAFEVEPGAASQPLPGGYRRHEPEQTALNAVVRGHLETVLDQSREGSASGSGYPVFVEGGRTEILLDPVAFMRRMAALVPAPYQNMLHYHGVFANRSKFRPLLPKPPARIRFEVPPADNLPTTPALDTPADDSPDRPRRLSWAKLLRRVLDVDALACARCATPMLVLAFLTDPPVVHRILDHLHLPSTPPPVTPAMTGEAGPEPEWDDTYGSPSARPRPAIRLTSRAPP